MNYDFLLVLDKSGSMSTTDCPGRKSRWAAAEESTLALANKCAEFDQDGISVVTFNAKAKRRDGVTPDTVKNLFMEESPGGGTSLLAALKCALSDFRPGTSKPRIVIVITDGAPTEESPRDVANYLVDVSKTLTKDEDLGITFLQIGRDADASKFLKNLDDALEKVGAKYDIVDTLTFEDLEDKSMTDVLLAAVND